MLDPIREEESPAFRAMEAAFVAKRKEMYGLLWDSVDWHGIADVTLPENQRQDIMRYLRGPHMEAIRNWRRP